MLNLLFYRCCSTPDCGHPKPTLYDWYSLAFCLYPKTTTVVEYVAKGVMMLLAVLAFWAFVFILFSLDVDPFYG